MVGKSWSSLGLTAPAVTSSASAAFFNLSQSVFSSLQFQLQAPMVITGSDSVIDQYNQYYAEYLTMFRAYETEIIAMNTNATIGRAGSVGTVTGAGLLSYSDFINYVAKIRGVATTSTQSHQPGDLELCFARATGGANNVEPVLQHRKRSLEHQVQWQPRLCDHGAKDYATIWVAYFFNVINTNLYDTGYSLPNTLRIKYGTATAPTLTNAAGLDAWKGVYAGIAVTAPYAPPAYTTIQTGYVSNSKISPADQIANNPGQFVSAAGITTVYNSTSSADLMTAAVSGKGSFSYDFVGGALFNADGTSFRQPQRRGAALDRCPRPSPVTSPSTSTRRTPIR